MYSQLNVPRREIRLLHLHPGLWDDDINAHLETVSLDDYPNYKAISYVWGDASQRLSITIDGEALSLTLSLYTALRRLRTPHSKLVLWTDAVCINQSDLDERSQQVGFMGEIYSRAEEVVIWLGYSSQLSAPKEQLHTHKWTGDDTGMELVNAYFEKIHSTGMEGGEEEEETENILGLFVFLKLRSMGKHLHEIPFFSVDKGKLNARRNWLSTLRAMHTLASNPWWTRMWVLQETVLARKATVAYHNMTAPWIMLADASSKSIVHDSLCCKDLLNTRHEREERILTNLQRLVYDDVELLRSTRAQGGSLSVKQLMTLTSLRDATDVRDKIYGLLGLVTNWRGTPPLIPDYNLPPREVFAQAIFTHIQSTLSLQSLMGTIVSGIPDIPSWVTARGRSRHLNLAEGARATRSSLFSTAGSTVANLTKTDEILRVDGFEPSRRVSQVGPTMTEASQTWEGMVAVTEAWLNMTRPDNIRYSTETAWKEAFWRTVINDSWEWDGSTSTTNVNQVSTIGGVSKVFRRFGDTAITSLADDFWKWLLVQLPDSDKNHIIHFENEIHKITLFCQSFLVSTTLRTLFFTTDGYIGMGPPGTVPGDHIAILCGGDVPFCIRVMEDAPSGHYTLVGDAYVHGMMDGEDVPVDWKESIIQVHLY
ncbi:hypothetical protein P3342_000058 [Pyrenophora teres f. teres]|uniref:Heterokaryon incompatibility domain-containing protein n=2 Tax=Pyrenophora teres f. teres TaxID=97479 RepID=E3S0E3_PYRTT|nr:hypothetical protein PTT_15518 [Pyrenophora teres f. teres 0-1]KAE8836709.1 hypothetical protein HRS9139_04807 [Pyrenophora teres f. teres]KAE8837318.1 hypothetical protein PTNB85_04653 [Pyrenophora teres f. teres]KAE8840259.1 hypothetical protein HRS9122_06864 [Pyrenophora teres f. teres]KAE8862144.1 hypothetical protein PTNB29_04706 [Pyrenophora teres f. teres]